MKRQETRRYVDSLRELNTDFAGNGREWIQTWYYDEEPVNVSVEGLRKAGLDIPDGPAGDD